MKLLAVFGLLAVVGCSTPDPAIPSSVGITDTAANITGLYESNEVAAKNKYTDRWADISGEISDIEEKGGLFEVSLRGKDFSFSDLVCKVPSDQLDAVSELRSGDRIEVRGLILGVTGITNVVVKPCTIIFPVSLTSQISSQSTQASSSVARSTQSDTSQQVIINDPKELNFTINDFPVGWQMETQEESGDGYQIRAVKLGTVIVVPEEIVSSWVGVFSDIDTAKLDYETRRQGHANRFRLEDPEIGESSYTYEGNATDEVIFRVGNVIAQVTMFTQYGGSIKNVERWANQLVDKIARLQRLGESVGSPTETELSTKTSTPSPTTAGTAVLNPSPIPIPTPTLGIPISDLYPPISTPNLHNLAQLPLGSLIAFASDRSGTSNIYLSTLDGSVTELLNEIPGGQPSWSPDGKNLVFVCEPGICIIGVDGIGLRRLTSGGNFDTEPKWSPDGETIAFTRYQNDTPLETDVRIIKSDGSGELDISAFKGISVAPSWSPDSSRVAFMSRDREGLDLGIFSASATGGDVTLISSGKAPEWSPVGDSIIHAAAIDGGWGIYKSKSDGSNTSHIAKEFDNSRNQDGVKWSPNGKFVAFVSNARTFNDLYVMSPDGTGRTKLTRNNQVSSISWSADSSRIAYTSSHNGNRDIYIVDTSGSEHYRLTDNQAHDSSPAWQPGN